MPSPADRSPPILLLPVLLLLFFSAAPAWKKDEFRNCDQTPFCKRARGRKPHSIPSLSAADVYLSDGAVSAHLLPSQPLHQATAGDEPESDRDPPRPLLLRLSVYQGGVLRLQIDEDPSAPRRRFQVPDVLLPDLDDRRLWLPRLSSPAAGSSSSFYLADGFEAVLMHDPFEIQVRRKDSAEPVLSLNSHGLFDFEQLRANKNDGEDWEERFRGHTDTRPHGPQSISFDVSFHGADFIYDIPEHASTPLALHLTSSPGIEYSKPYHLFNLDVFEYLDDSPFGLSGSIPFMLSHGARSSSPSLLLIPLLLLLFSIASLVMSPLPSMPTPSSSPSSCSLSATQAVPPPEPLLPSLYPLVKPRKEIPPPPPGSA